MNMIDEKDPRQESVKVDSSEDEVIIDLTDEVNDKTDIDNDSLKLSNDMVDEAPLADEDGKVSEEEEILALDGSDNLESQGDEAAIDLYDQAAEDQAVFGEDQLIASAMKNVMRAEKDETEELTEQIDLNSFKNVLRAEEDETEEVTEQLDLNSFKNVIRADKDETEEVTEQFDLNSFDNVRRADKDETEEMTEQFDLNSFDEEDVIIIDNSRDEADENNSAMAGGDTADAQRDEDVFDLEEQIDLDYELDDDEEELIEIGDERIENNQDFVDLMLGVSKESDQGEDAHEPAEYFEFKTEEPDVVVLDTDRDRDTDTIAPAGDKDPEFIANDDLPDIEAVSDLDFEDEEDGLAIDEHKADSGDDIIARTVEQSLRSDDDREYIDPADDAEFRLEEDEATLGSGGSQGDDEQILAPAEDAPFKFGNDDDLLDLEKGADLEDYTEIIPRDEFNGLKAEDEEDIIEITEFDQHYPADDEALLKQSAILDASGADEDGFLELIDSEEDQPESILNDGLEDMPQVNELTGSIFDDSAQMKSGLDNEVPGAAEEAAEESPGSTTDAQPPNSTDETFDFNFDSNSISQQVDRLDTFLSEDGADKPELASLPVDRVAEEETGLEESKIIQGMDELPAVPTGQIDAAIERIIREKFSDKIENIIYEVIEKAVAKEIDRIKVALTGRNTIGDYED
jgi:hypothetical protein